MIQPPASGDYEVDRRRHVRALAARMPGEVEKMTWPLERLHALRDERLRAVVRAAKERSPWHARRLRHIDPDALRGDDLTAIPPMTKDELMEHWDEIVTDRRLSLELVNAHLARVAERGPAYLLDDYHAITSGGMSRGRGVFAWDFDGWVACEISLRRANAWLAERGLATGNRRRASIMASQAIHISAAVGRTFAGASPIPTVVLPATRPIAEIVAELNAFQPTHVVTYPVILAHLASEALAGRLRIRPEALICSGEPLRPEVAAGIEAALGAPINNCYGCSEAGVMAHSFPGSRGMHLVEDIAVYEPVDADGRPVPAGVPGAKMLVTNVVSSLLPLLRYELTDEVTLLAEPSTSPWTGRRIADVQGRRDDIFVYPGGLVVHPQVFKLALARTPELIGFQVRQTLSGADISVCAAAAADLEPIRREIADGLASLGLPEPEVSIALVASLARMPASGKLRHFIPLQLQNEGLA